MSAARTGARLLRAYPRGWRERYGAELEALIAEANEGGRVSMATRLDVVRAGLGERVRAAGLRPEGSPRQRARAEVLRVLCAWALFAFAGLVVAKFSEHWQGAVHGGGSLARVAFVAILAGAGCGSALVLAGIAIAVPAFLRLLRAGGWGKVRGPLLVSVLVAGALAAATAGLALWSGSLNADQRNGDDALYAAAFLVWAALIAASFAIWAGAAIAIARRLELAPRVVRVQAWLAAGAAAAIGFVAAATAIWWIGMADSAPGFFGGSTLAPQLFAAIALMALALWVAAPAAWRAAREAPRISEL